MLSWNETAPYTYKCIYACVKCAIVETFFRIFLLYASDLFNLPTRTVSLKHINYDTTSLTHISVQL